VRGEGEEGMGEERGAVGRSGKGGGQGGGGGEGAGGGRGEEGKEEGGEDGQREGEENERVCVCVWGGATGEEREAVPGERGGWAHV